MEDALACDDGGQMAMQATLDIPEPRNRRQTMESQGWDEWRKAEETEMLGMVENCVYKQVARPKDKLVVGTKMLFIYLFIYLFFFSVRADGPHHYHPACGHKGSSHLSPVHALQFFYRDASSALLQLVNQWLNFTYSRSHAFRYERKNTHPNLVRIELTTSVLADVQLTY